MAPHPGKDPISALVVDDELLARRNLTVLLRADPDIGSIEECGSGAKAVEAIRQRKPDLVFLDVQMPQCDGFDVLELLGTDLPQAIVFVTAHDQYALRAFESGALDYLLKPFDDARFMRALARAKEKIARHRPHPELAHPERPHRELPRRLPVKSPGRMLFIDVLDIDWVEAASYYSCLHVGPDTHIVRRTMAELERDLGESDFIRIHRSIIVNIQRVRGLELQDSGEFSVVLRCGTHLRLSRQYKKPLEARLLSSSRTSEGA